MIEISFIKKVLFVFLFLSNYVFSQTNDTVLWTNYPFLIDQIAMRNAINIVDDKIQEIKINKNIYFSDDGNFYLKREIKNDSSIFYEIFKKDSVIITFWDNNLYGLKLYWAKNFLVMRLNKYSGNRERFLIADFKTNKIRKIELPEMQYLGQTEDEGFYFMTKYKTPDKLKKNNILILNAKGHFSSKIRYKKKTIKKISNLSINNRVKDSLIKVVKKILISTNKDRTALFNYVIISDKIKNFNIYSGKTNNYNNFILLEDTIIIDNSNTFSLSGSGGYFSKESTFLPAYSKYEVGLDGNLYFLGNIYQVNSNRILKILSLSYTQIFGEKNPMLNNGIEQIKMNNGILYIKITKQNFVNNKIETFYGIILYDLINNMFVKIDKLTIL